MQFVLSINDTEYTISTDDVAVLTAITELRHRYNEMVGEEVFATDGAYLTKVFGDWAKSNPGFSQADLDAALISAGASWTNQVAVPEVFTRDLTEEEIKTALKAYADQKHTTVLGGGVTIGGVPVSTTERGLIMLQGAYSAAQADPALVVAWVKDDGTPIELSAAQVTAVALAVFAWVQNTYTVLGAANVQITDGTITTTAQIDALTWSAS